jgi:hypothetical protein
VQILKGLRTKTCTAIPHFVGSEPRCVAHRADGWRFLLNKFRRPQRVKLFVRRDILIMDDEFLKQRAQFIRDLADKADPFIKRRLMDLARNYDARIARPSRATVTLLSNGSEIE